MVIARLSSLLVVLVALSCVATAVDFHVEFVPEEQIIRLNETAQFELSIENFGDERTFEIYSPDVAWDVRTDPTEDRLLTIGENSRRATQLLIKPLYITPGYYVLPIHVRPVGTNKVIKSNVLIGVNSLTPPPRDYVPSIRVTSQFPDTIDPREPVEMTVVLDNRNRKHIEEIRVKVVSELFNKEYTTTLPPLERKELTFKLSVDPLTPPREDIVRVHTIIPTEEWYRFDAEPQRVSIMEYGAVEEEQQTDAQLLKRQVHVTLTNNANVMHVHTTHVPMSFIKRIWSEASPKPQLVETDEGTLWQWTVQLDSNETQTISITTNYRPIAYVILVMILGVLAYLFTRSPVVVKKSAMILEKREGGISELKVLIELRNRSHKSVREVCVVDKVPAMVSVMKKFEMGTLEPSRITSDTEGNTLIKWKLDELDSFEERVLAYKIRSKFSILGNLNLPLALSTYHTHTGRKRKTKSNITQIGFGH